MCSARRSDMFGCFYAASKLVLLSAAEFAEFVGPFLEPRGARTDDFFHMVISRGSGQKDQGTQFDLQNWSRKQKVQTRAGLTGRFKKGLIKKKKQNKKKKKKKNRTPLVSSLLSLFPSLPLPSLPLSPLSTILPSPEANAEPLWKHARNIRMQQLVSPWGQIGSLVTVSVPIFYSRRGCSPVDMKVKNTSIT